jgi:hypothetical protein
MTYTKNQLNSIYFGDGIIRGPIVWDSKAFRKFHGFNDVSFFLGRDDCDLAYRARKYNNSRVAFLPCRSFSNPEEGTTRKLRSLSTLKEMEKRAALASQIPGELSKFWSLSKDSRQKVFDKDSNYVSRIYF